MLCYYFQINAEFLRVTAVPLEIKFLAQLDKYSAKLLEVIRFKGGRVKEQTAMTLQAFDEVKYELVQSNSSCRVCEILIHSICSYSDCGCCHQKGIHLQISDDLPG